MVILISIFIFCFIIGGLLFIIYKKQMQFWLPGYLAWQLKRKHANNKIPLPPFTKGEDEVIHLMFCIVDHFEPGNSGVPLDRERERVSQWVERYPLLASKHQDADGKTPQHTWFFPPHYHRQDHLQRLVQLCLNGYGDIEMHLHHDHLLPYSETSETLREKILTCLDDYGKYGVFTSGNGQKRTYGFIHGDWALDNSRGGKWCGINNELTILKETGCYADFTFPSINESQPRKINSIYYATDEPHKPKSYNTGIDVQVGGRPIGKVSPSFLFDQTFSFRKRKSLVGDLMIIQGPLGLRWKKRGRWPYPAIENSDLTGANPPTKERVDFWVKTGIHVKGRPNWVIIKLHTHGGPEENQEVLLGTAMDKMFHYLETQYNDGQRYKLHYCTARELYNIIKAAEAGEEGDPGQYRNYLILPYKYRKL